MQVKGRKKTALALLLKNIVCLLRTKAQSCHLHYYANNVLQAKETATSLRCVVRVDKVEQANKCCMCWRQAYTLCAAQVAELANSTRRRLRSTL